jgi:hypothetical protein
MPGRLRTGQIVELASVLGLAGRTSRGKRNIYKWLRVEDTDGDERSPEVLRHRRLPVHKLVLSSSNSSYLTRSAVHRENARVRGAGCGSLGERDTYIHALRNICRTMKKSIKYPIAVLHFHVSRAGPRPRARSEHSAERRSCVGRSRWGF